MTGEVVWRLIALKNIESHNVSTGGRFEVQESEALGLIESGRAWVVSDPQSPPWDFLASLEDKLKDLSVLGPRTDFPEETQKISSRVFIGGVRQAVVDGRAIRWVSGKGGLRRLLGQTLSQTEGGDFDHFHLLRYFAFSSIDGWHGHHFNRRNEIYTDEFARRQPEDCEDMAVLVHNHRADPGWDAFVFRALCLQADFETAICEGLRQGRIVVGQSSPAGDRHIPPQVAGSLATDRLTEDYYFALSRDLPDFAASLPLESQRARATKFIERAYAYFQPTGRMFSAETMKSFVQQKYRLRPNAARVSWKNANIPAEGFRNRAVKDKVLPHEIKEFADIEREK